MADTLTIALDPPIKWAEGLEFSEIILAEPTVDEWEKASRIDNSIAGHIMLISLVATRCAGRPVPETVVRKMKHGELLRAIDFFQTCTAATRFPPGPDGPSSSPSSAIPGAA